ncbi:MAG: hypothetical protein QE263_04490 [Vampirovibrionales bacterium]|nr:hypothetical protein [Vampirovibrionales bacterium]
MLIRLKSNSGKKAKALLSDLLANYDKVKGLHGPAWGMRPSEETMQQADAKEKLGISIMDIGQLASGYGNKDRLERLDFSNMKNYYDEHGYPP